METSEEKNLFYFVKDPQRKYLEFVKVDLTDKIKEKEKMINEIKKLKPQKSKTIMNEMIKLMPNTSHKGDEFKALKAKIKALEAKTKKLDLYIEIYQHMNIIVDEIYNNINQIYFEGGQAQKNFNNLYILEPYTEYHLYKEFNLVISYMYAKLTKINDWEKEPKLLTEIVVLRELITGYTNVLGIQETELKARLAKEDKKHSNDSAKKEKGLIESEDDQNEVYVQDKITELKYETKSYLSNILLAYEQIYDIIIKNRNGKSIKHHTNVKKELLKTLKEANALKSELIKSFASEILTYYQNE
ncbi:unnamed protein product [Meloidogyne enterolobii]|uniref:Uncharacterized protein n=1 Tax=Meloidogyne enterolobii TaxID=390850 RepID=A0ACB1A7M2_MELEN